MRPPGMPAIMPPQLSPDWQGPQSACKGKVNPPHWGITKYERAEKQVWDVMESMNDNDKIQGDEIMKMFCYLIY
eukprot:8665320-Karenia_brevis.AAC.1